MNFSALKNSGQIVTLVKNLNTYGEIDLINLSKEIKISQTKTAKTIDYMLEGVIINHDRKSKLFKPEVSIIHDIRELLQDYRSYKKGKNSSVYLHITSDGRRALVKLIPPPKSVK